MLESASVGITTNIEDVLQQIQLPQFHGSFLATVPEDKRDGLLRDTANTLKFKNIAVDHNRYWRFFVFKKRRCIHIDS
jgi:hypothetical protein